MKRFRLWQLGLMAVMALLLSACGGGGGGSADLDADGVPNTGDAAPGDPAIFAAFSDFLLDTLDLTNTFSSASDINNTNMVVGFSEDGAANITAVKWSFDPVAQNSTVTPLDPIGANTYSAAYGANDTGDIVGESAQGADFSAVIWSGGAIVPTVLQKGAMTLTAAYGINAAGQIVGEGNDTGNTVALIWNNSLAAPVPLGTLAGGTTSSAYYISDGGMVVGEGDDIAGETHALLWLVDAGVPAAPIDLGKLNVTDVSSIAYGANDLGEVVGESETALGEIHAVRWMVDALGAVTATVDMGRAGFDSTAYANNEFNRTAGWDAAGGTGVASVWDSRSIDSTLSNPVLAAAGASRAFGLNDSNMTVGLSGSRAFVAIP